MISSTCDTIDGWMNPIHVKELRQVIKAKVLVAILLLILSCMVVVFYFFIENMSPRDERVGAILFTVCSSILSIVCVVFLPFYLFIKTGSERKPEDLDLMYITKMSPTKIIFGKYATGLSLLTLFICIFMPFMAFSYVLKGIDLVNIFTAIAGVLLGSFTFIQLGLLFGSIQMNSRSRIGLACLAAFMLFMFMSNSIFYYLGYFGYYSGFRSGVSSSVSNYLCQLFLLVLWWIFIFILNRSILMPPMSNRAFAPRLCISLFWFISLAAVIINDAGYMQWFICFYVISIAALFFSMGERDKLSKRVRSSIPNIKYARLLAFLYYSGSGAGILWSILTIAATVVTGTYISVIKGNEIDDNFAMGAMISSFSIFGYSMLIFWITRLFRHHKTQRTSGGISFAFIMILSALIVIIHEALRRKAEWVLFVSPFCGLISDDKQTAMILSSIWALVALLFVVKKLFVQIKDFKPYDKENIRATVKLAESIADEHIT